MLFDTHAHLNDKAFEEDREALFEAFQADGTNLVMIPGWNLASSQQAVALANAHDGVYAAVGSHPDSADTVDEAQIETYRQLCCQNPEKVRAIGEIGLDYHYEDVPREIQQKAFRMQMTLAQELGLPVIVHERDAHEDGMAIVSEFPDVTGVFHCYSGNVEMAAWLVERGWYIGFTGVLTFKNAKKALNVVKSLPHDRIVIETDCPYMAPDPFRGTRNDPCKLYRMAEKLAEVLEISVEAAQTLTYDNGKRLYRL